MPLRMAMVRFVPGGTEGAASPYSAVILKRAGLIPGGGSNRTDAVPVTVNDSSLRPVPQGLRMLTNPDCAFVGTSTVNRVAVELTTCASTPLNNTEFSP